MNLQPLTGAILGAGNMGTCLAQAFHKVPGLSVKYVYSRTLPHDQSLARQVRAEPVDHVDRIFADGEVDIVVVCLPTHTRLETLKRAIRTKKHIFCEKPLALNKTMADEIGGLLKGYSMTVMVGQVLRFFWEYRRLREMIQSGAVGQVGTIRLSRCVGYPGAGSWFGDPEKSGGVILDLLIHDIDFLLWTFGEIKQVYARSLTYTQQGKLDYALLNIQMESGALAHLEGSWSHPVGSFQQTAEICGSHGMLSYDNLSCKSLEWVPTAELEKQLTSRISLPETNDSHNPYFSEVSHFVDCVRNHRIPDVTYEEALRSCGVAFMAIESAKLGVPLQSGQPAG